MDLNIGRVLDGRYEITELIGIGGMADVYKADDIMENKVVAVKILKNEFSGSEEFLRRFRNESKAIAVLSHPNIVKIFDLGFSDEIQYIVMEFIDGITLKEFIEQQGVLRWKDSLHFITQILRALQHAHDRGIVHRDIKPQNIMIFADGTVKVMDFGIARFSRVDGKTLSDKTIGSVHYISPEQARGDVTDERSDIYSVGAMLYEMLTGRKPFDGDNPVSVALMHMQETAVYPRDLVPTIPAAIEEIVVHAMEKSPAKRYQSAAQMIKDIDTFKLNPTIVFGYLSKAYAQEDNGGSTRYFSPVPGGTGAYGDDYEDEAYDDEEDYEEPKRSYVIPILAATTVAVVIIVAVLIVTLISKGNNDSGGDTVVRIENYVGQSFDEVKSAHSDELNISSTLEYNATIEKGYIIDQSIKAGTTVDKGAKISFTVSNGARPVVVPDVTKMSLDDGKNQITQYGLKSSEVKEYSDDVEKGLIIRTEPAAGETSAEGSTVVIYVSNGPSSNQTLKVPNVVGQTLADAQAALSKAGFNNVKIDEIDTLENAGKVIAQDPVDGQFIAGTDKITIQVSTGKIVSQSVNIDLPIPTGAKGSFNIITLIDGNKAGNQPLEDAEAVAGSTISIPVTGEGTRNITIKVLNTKTNKEAIYAKYVIDFTTGTKTESSRDEAAFLSLVETTTTPTTTTAPENTTTPPASTPVNTTTPPDDGGAD
ncbi:MAG: Stk1 family PASTA domain-containing Ser/Thr kinase [Oscillospiraceae bacterium]